MEKKYNIYRKEVDLITNKDTNKDKKILTDTEKELAALILTATDLIPETSCKDIPLYRIIWLVSIGTNIKTDNHGFEAFVSDLKEAVTDYISNMEKGIE